MRSPKHRPTFPRVTAPQGETFRATCVTTGEIMECAELSPLLRTIADDFDYLPDAPPFKAPPLWNVSRVPVVRDGEV